MTNPSPELIAKHPKTKINGVYTPGPGKKLYFIPENELPRFEVPAGSEQEHDPVPEPETDEVTGRHAVWLQNGTFGWHSDWLVGSYLWVTDGSWYYGVHRHPWGTIAAIDLDN